MKRSAAATSDGRLHLEQMLGRRGANCDAWRASGRRDGFEAFCPNADFIGRCAP